MGALSVATGITLLSDEGLLPPNASRQALAFASPAEGIKLGSDGLAFKATVTGLAMEDHAADGSSELSPAALQFLVQDLASKSAPAPQPAETAPQQSGYPYGGWAEPVAPTSMATASSVATSASINLLA